jgi:hypothetical protein
MPHTQILHAQPNEHTQRTNTRNNHTIGQPQTTAQPHGRANTPKKCLSATTNQYQH